MSIVEGEHILAWLSSLIETDEARKALFKKALVFAGVYFEQQQEEQPQPQEELQQQGQQGEPREEQQQLPQKIQQQEEEKAPGPPQEQEEYQPQEQQEHNPQQQALQEEVQAQPAPLTPEQKGFILEGVCVLLLVHAILFGSDADSDDSANDKDEKNENGRLKKKSVMNNNVFKRLLSTTAAPAAGCTIIYGSKPDLRRDLSASTTLSVNRCAEMIECKENNLPIAPTIRPKGGPPRLYTVDSEHAIWQLVQKAKREGTPVVMLNAERASYADIIVYTPGTSGCMKKEDEPQADRGGRGDGEVGRLVLVQSKNYPTTPFKLSAMAKEFHVMGSPQYRNNGTNSEKGGTIPQRQGSSNAERMACTARLVQLCSMNKAPEHTSATTTTSTSTSTTTAPNKVEGAAAQDERHDAAQLVFQHDSYDALCGWNAIDQCVHQIDTHFDFTVDYVVAHAGTNFEGETTTENYNYSSSKYHWKELSMVRSPGKPFQSGPVTPNDLLLFKNQKLRNEDMQLAEQNALCEKSHSQTSVVFSKLLLNRRKEEEEDSFTVRHRHYCLRLPQVATDNPPNV